MPSIIDDPSRIRVPNLNVNTNENPPDISPQTALVLVGAILFFFSIIRIIFSSSIGFGVDETYYLSVGRSLSLSYLDHPPLTFWITHIITLFQNIPSSLFARAFFILLSIPTLYLLYDLTAYLFSRRAGVYTIIIYSIAPVLSLANSSWILPDGPLTFFLLLTASCLARLCVEPQEPLQITHHRPLHIWALAGAAFGFAALTKYHAPLWLLGVFLYMLFEKNARYWLTKKYPWIALIIAFIISSPVLIWNAQNDWASFIFQASRSIPEDAAHSFDFIGLFVSFIGQALWLSPWIFILIIFSLIASFFSPSKSTTFCLFLGLPLVLFFSLITLINGTGLPHWQMPGYVFILPLSGHLLAKIKNQQKLLPWIIFAIIVFIISTFTASSHTQHGVLQKFIPRALQFKDPTFDATNWESLQEPLNTYLQADTGAVILATHWIHAAKIDFITGSSKPVIIPFSHPHHFPYRYSLNQMKHQTAILAVPRNTMGEFIHTIRRFYTKIDFLETISIKRGQQTIHQIELWHLER
jgi:4-amino-4-deoxy-L-arabinose transferase-like glycosyltransferase